MRRGPSRDSQDSLKENNGVNGVTNNNKTINERVARGKRAAMREHIDANDERDAEAEEDAQGEEDKDEHAEVSGEDGEEDQDQGGDPSRRKRARVNTEGDSLATGSIPKVEKRRQTLPRDEDG